MTTGANTAAVDATMTTGGTISGFTKTTTGDPTQVVRRDRPRRRRHAQHPLRLDSSGTGRFVITGLSPGSYKVVVLNCVNVEKWYDDSKAKNVSTVKADADLVTVTDGNTTGIGTLRVKAG